MDDAARRSVPVDSAAASTIDRWCWRPDVGGDCDPFHAATVAVLVLIGDLGLVLECRVPEGGGDEGPGGGDDGLDGGGEEGPDDGCDGLPRSLEEDAAATTVPAAATKKRPLDARRIDDASDVDSAIWSTPN